MGNTSDVSTSRPVVVMENGGVKGLCPASQMVLQLLQAADLSGPCARLVLQIISSLLLGENVHLPPSLIQQTVKKVCVCVCVCGWVGLEWLWTHTVVDFSGVWRRDGPGPDSGVHQGDVHHETV